MCISAIDTTTFIYVLQGIMPSFEGTIRCDFEQKLQLTAFDSSDWRHGINPWRHGANKSLLKNENKKKWSHSAGLGAVAPLKGEIHAEIGSLGTAAPTLVAMALRDPVMENEARRKWCHSTFIWCHGTTCCCNEDQGKRKLAPQHQRPLKKRKVGVQPPSGWRHGTSTRRRSAKEPYR